MNKASWAHSLSQSRIFNKKSLTETLQPPSLMALCSWTVNRDSCSCDGCSAPSGQDSHLRSHLGTHCQNRCSPPGTSMFRLTVTSAARVLHGNRQRTPLCLVFCQGLWVCLLTKRLRVLSVCLHRIGNLVGERWLSICNNDDLNKTNEWPLACPRLTLKILPLPHSLRY